MIPFRTGICFALACVMLGVLFVSSTAMAADSMPIDIAADKMRYSPSGKQVVFEGKVHVSRPDFQIWAAKITITLAGKKGKKSEPVDSPMGAIDPGGIEKIVATGGVRIDYQGKKGSCSTATYYANEGLLRLDGKPTLQDGKNKVVGHVIKFYLKDNRSEVIGGEKQRVKFTLQSPAKMKKK